MPKVRMLTTVAGPDFDWQHGQIVEMDEKQASEWADGERAVRLERNEQPENTARTQPENTARRVSRQTRQES